MKTIVPKRDIVSCAAITGRGEAKPMTALRGGSDHQVIKRELIAVSRASGCSFQNRFWSSPSFIFVGGGGGGGGEGGLRGSDLGWGERKAGGGGVGEMLEGADFGEA